MFQHRAGAELRETILDYCHAGIHLVRKIFLIANIMCHIIAAALFFLLAFYLATVAPQQGPANHLFAFMAGWFGIGIGCAALELLERQEDGLDPLFKDGPVSPLISMPPPPDDKWLEELLRTSPPKPAVPN